MLTPPHVPRPTPASDPESEERASMEDETTAMNMGQSEEEGDDVVIMPPNVDADHGRVCPSPMVGYVVLDGLGSDAHPRPTPCPTPPTHHVYSE